MGSVFSCLASTFIYLGEFLENVFLAIGEIGAVLVRAVIGIVVSLCDLLAAISCCYRVPWSERPDRSFYTYGAANTNLASTNTTLATVGGKQVLSSVFTKEGREQRKEIKAARKKAAVLKAEEDAAVRFVKKEEEAKKKAEATAQKQKAKEDKEKAALKATEEKKAAAAAEA
ncbi:uncharacterized protein UTRI_01780 [Ustilago trichophora]|uniref:Uncharacterized protein n=1 Tax=Ustilago trichophora TaxID=86804 RepID=A0A5C3DXZ6_9BASI|nr:uncharacterized protein UTRI_01780 [Ustilago trichophora]